ncbi:MAG: tetratricopeptide repeat protein, partial [Planctomycetes bacterium]|nr:tetratricopeptide repeat protein [Planctomycetota bacterium]
MVLLLGSLSPGLWAQDKLEREIVFVRALAKEMRFIELAKEEAERLATDYRGAGEQDRIAQLAVQVAYYGAKLRSDRSLQRTLFKEALDKSKELAEATADANLQLQARMTLADAAQDFGQFLIEELEFGREAAPDKVKELEEEAFGVFRTGIDACGKVMEHLRPQRKNEGRNTEYLLLWMRKGVLMREQARAVKADRAVLVQRAIDELTEMVLDAGEETAIGLRGLFEIAQCYEVGGDTRQALDQYRTTIGQISKSLDEADELGLSGDVQGLLFEMLQEVSVRAGDVMVSTGAAGTDELFKTFREQMQKHGEKGVELFDVVDPRWGHLMFLAECRFLAESGDKKKAADALAMVLRVNEKHPNDYVGIKAKAVLRDILGLQQGPIPAKYLFEVAKGEFQNKNYEEAIKGLRRTLATMNAEDAVALGLEAWEMLGTAFGLTERYLEATIAMTEGLQKLGNADKDKASDLADALDRAVARLKLQSKNAPEFGPVLAAAAKEITERGGANVGAKLFWKSANDLFNQKKYAAAIAEYAKIPPDFVFHENAQVNIARAHQVQGNFAEARRVLQTFREHVAATKLDPKDPKAQYRGGAVATAEFVDAQMSYAEARGSDEPKIAKDPKKYPEALQKLRGFVTNFAKDGEANLPAALEAIGRLHSD